MSTESELKKIQRELEKAQVVAILKEMKELPALPTHVIQTNYEKATIAARLLKIIKPNKEYQHLQSRVKAGLELAWQDTSAKRIIVPSYTKQKDNFNATFKKDKPPETALGWNSKENLMAEQVTTHEKEEPQGSDPLNSNPE